MVAYPWMLALCRVPDTARRQAGTVGLYIVAPPSRSGGALLQPNSRDHLMKVVHLIVGPLQSNCYILVDELTGRGVVIDPGGDAEQIARALAIQGVELVAVLCTHGHPDHVAAANRLVQCISAGVVYIHPDEVAMLPHYVLPELGEVQLPELTKYEDGDTIRIGKLTVRVVHTPGHSPGSVCLAVDEERVLFTGDLIFAGSIGRTDLPGGNEQQMRASLRRIMEQFPPDTLLYPGHGPQSTLAEELASNPWLAGLS